MRARAWLLLLCACGEPEQLLDVEGTLATIGVDGSQTVSLLRGDRGVSADPNADTGCGRFTQLQSLKVPLGSRFDFQVLREEVAAPSGARCFRVDWESDDAAHSSLTFAPFDHDVALPPLAVWPGLELAGLRDSPVFSCGPQCQAFEFDAVPGNLIVPTDDFVFLPPRQFVEAFDNTGVLWRSTNLLACFGDRCSGVFEAEWSEGRAGVSLRAGAVMSGVRYIRDRVGRLVTLFAEYRVTGGPLPLQLQSPLGLASRGASCDGFDPCPFTDGDFTPVDVHGLTQVTLDLGQDVEASSVLIRGAWLDPMLDPFSVQLEGAAAQAPDAFNPLDSAGLTADGLALGQDGLAGTARIDVRFLNVGRIRWLRVSFRDRNNTQALPLTRLAEVSVFQ